MLWLYFNTFRRLEVEGKLNSIFLADLLVLFRWMSAIVCCIHYKH